jgi:hypothetical protein
MKDSKPVKRLKLSRETLRFLADGELRKVAGREPSQNYTQCLTDTCSVNYCFTAGPGCPKNNC